MGWCWYARNFFTWMQKRTSYIIRIEGSSKSFYYQLLYFVGCVDIKNCKCKLQLSNENDIQELIIGKDKSLNVSFTLANVGDEPSLGSKIGFIFPIHLKLIESPEYICSIDGQRDYDLPTESQVSRILKFVRHYQMGTNFYQLS